MLITHPRIMMRRIPASFSARAVICSIASLFPKVFCASLLTWSIYAHLFSTCSDLVLKKNHKIGGLVCGIIGFILFFQCIFLYFRLIKVGPGSPLEFEELKIKDNVAAIGPRYKSSNPYSTNSSPSFDEDENSSYSVERPPHELMSMHTLKDNGFSYRYCVKCSVWKPDRCHHCSVCEKCILRMDHHCPWFATCIGFHNQKFFIQFLFYVTVYSFFVFIMALTILWTFFTDEEYSKEFLSLHLVFLTVLGFVIFLSVGVFSCFLIYLILVNKTTIEFQEKASNYRGLHFSLNNSSSSYNPPNIFDLGYVYNWTSVMGPNWITWLFPVSVTNRSIYSLSNNGINFDINRAAYEDWYSNAKLQYQLNRQFAAYSTRKLSTPRS